MADPAQRHGGPDAGWYVPSDHGWQRISDGEVGDHRDAAHFMSDPNGRHGQPLSEQLAAEISEALGHAERGHTVDLGSFAQYADHGQDTPAS